MITQLWFIREHTNVTKGIKSVLVQHYLTSSYDATGNELPLT